MPICGVLDESISPYLKAWVKQGDRMVCGIIGPGTSRTLTSKWDSPLEQSNASSGVSDVVSGSAQAALERTTITQFSSTQVWQGNMPLKTMLNLIFIAQSNAYEEVMKPLQWLEEFASPGIGSGLDIGGRIPATVTINVGRKIIVANCVLESIPIPLDKEKDASGNLIRAEVNLDIQTKVMLTQKEPENSITSNWKTESW